MISEPDGTAAPDPIRAAAWKVRLGKGSEPVPHQPLLQQRLPPYLVEGNRFASVGLVCALFGLALALVDGWPVIAWTSAVAGVGLACAGFVKYCRGIATNRDSAALGGVIAWIALVVLLTRASIALGIPMTTPAP